MREEVGFYIGMDQQLVSYAIVECHAVDNASKVLCGGYIHPAMPYLWLDIINRTTTYMTHPRTLLKAFYHSSQLM
ncbi:hypothetical protein EB796_000201 [Bugula neritina]|uniref:Uncharacterized protein n=1 Tax=Bugula neritina TaxID=10212 RepID=A0A7J7KTF5_BUGNE|nr:hypothetical protein EB796_000201 [Bugula neritina]